MEFVFAQNSDTDRIKELWQQDFESYEPYFSWYFSKIYRPERTLCLKQEGRILACLQFAPYTIRLRNCDIACPYIVGVITDESCRGKGLGRELMREGLRQVVKNRNASVCVLKPAVPLFYLKQGFRFSYAQFHYSLPMDELAPLAGVNISAHHLNIDTEWPVLASIYRQMLNHSNGYVLRTEQNWRNFYQELCGDGGNGLIFLRNGQPCAYLFYYIKNRTFFAREIGFYDRAARSSVFAHIKNNFSNCKIFSWEAPYGDNSHLLLADFNGVHYKPSLMTRVCNLRILEQMTYPQLSEGQICLQIHDDFLPELTQLCVLSITNGKGRFEPFHTTALSAELNCAELAQLVFGFSCAEQLASQGLLKADNRSLAFLQKILPLQQNFMSEEA